MAADDPQGVMADLIDTVATYMITDHPQNEHNELQTFRLLRIVQDMPETIPAEDRLAVWEHLLGADWFYEFADIGHLEQAISRLTGEHNIGSNIIQLAVDIFAKKSDKFATEFGYTAEVRPIDYKDFDFMAAMSGQGILQRLGRDEAYYTYSSMVALGMMLSIMSRDQLGAI